ncbi:MAG: glycosyltransferase [Planctomycetota bacterium]
MTDPATEHPSDRTPAPPVAADPTGATLIECAWEVCNKVGGIYQVIRSKAPKMVDRWGRRYTLLGPCPPEGPPIEFEPRRPSGRMATVVKNLAERGVVVHHGEWLVSGSPRVLLVEHAMSLEDLASAKYAVWDRFGIDLPGADPLLDSVVTFSQRAFEVVRELSRVEGGAKKPRRVVAHFHEWMCGLAIPMLRRDAGEVRTLFTTHATLLGRYMASNDEAFYDHLEGVDQAAEASLYNVRTQHAIERASAHGAHIFTTVSPITGEECAKLLGRAPDAIVPNGLNMDRFDVGHEFQTLHGKYKEAIHRFVMGYFFPSYEMDLDRTLYFFTSGRFEPKNKGFDLCLEAMARLNAQLREFEFGTNVVLFIITDRPTRNINPDVLQHRAVLSELDAVCESMMREVEGELFRKGVAGGRVNLDDLVSRYWALRFRRTQQALRREGLPPVVTHVMEDEGTDPVLNHIRQLGLFNREEDPVKIVYHPRFVSTVNPLWGIEYEQFVRGCHLGVFPSAYEPWGYTPLECIASGVPAITSDLAGFGRYAREHLPDHDEWGLTVLPRRGRSFHDSAADLARRMLQFCRLERRGRIALRNEVEARAEAFDWDRLARFYDEAHDRALAIR